MKFIKIHSREILKQLTILFALLLLFSVSGNTAAGEINNCFKAITSGLTVLTQNELESGNPLYVESNTLFSFQIPRTEYVKFAVYDWNGKELKVLINEVKQAGSFSAELRSAELTKGTFYYRLDVGRYREVRKLIITK